MDKITYLAQLAEGLARWVPERERQDILRYYAEYFEEAGEEREAEVVAELGDPWALSSRLAVEGGYVSHEGAASWTPRQSKRKIWPWVLLGTAAVLVFIVGAIFTAVMNFSGLIGRAVSDVVISSAVDNAVAIPDVQMREEWEFRSGPSTEAGTAYIVEGGAYQDGGFWTMEDGCLEPFDAIDADISLGNITVTAADDYTLFINQSAALNGYSITWEVKGGKLKLKDSSSGHADITGFKDLQNLFGGSAENIAVEISITVPEGALLDKITAKTGLGNVFVSSVDAEKLTMSTGLGNVECYEPRQVKKLNMETGMGNVTLGMGELWDGLDIDLETGMGNVEANMGCFEDECEYEAKSGLGNVTVNGVSRGSKANHKGSYSCKLDAESGMGDVNVFFYEDRW